MDAPTHPPTPDRLPPTMNYYHHHRRLQRPKNAGEAAVRAMEYYQMYVCMDVTLEEEGEDVACVVCGGG